MSRYFFADLDDQFPEFLVSLVRQRILKQLLNQEVDLQTITLSSTFVLIEKLFSLSILVQIFESYDPIEQNTEVVSSGPGTSRERSDSETSRQISRRSIGMIEDEATKSPSFRSNSVQNVKKRGDVDSESDIDDLPMAKKQKRVLISSSEDEDGHQIQPRKTIKSQDNDREWTLKYTGKTSKVQFVVGNV